jgi:RNA recognition motif-containing protein
MWSSSLAKEPKTYANLTQAIKRDGEFLDRRYLKVELARGGKPSESRPISLELNAAADGSESKTIFVKNLPYDTNEEEVNEYFMRCGQVESVRLVYNSLHKHFKGFGYVDFKNKASVKEAIKLDGKVFKGRALVIDVDTSKPKEGFKYRGTEDNRKFSRQWVWVI